MTSLEAQRVNIVLLELAERRDRDILDWLALIEDKLRGLLPADSQLLARFLRVRARADPEGKGPPFQASAEIERECKGVVRAVCDLITIFRTEAGPPLNLEQEVDRVIQKGYFQSWYFRLVIGGLVLVGLLVTGVASFKINDQVQAMQRLVDKARDQVEAGQKEVAQAKSEIANRRAELALMVLLGNEELTKMRLNAVTELTKVQNDYRTELEERKKHWLSELDEAGPKGTQKIVEAGNTGKQKIEDRTKQSLETFGGIEKQHRDKLADKVQSVIQSLEASQHPWVPIIVWSVAKYWLILPLALLISVSAWIYVAVNGLRHGALWNRVAIIVNAVLLMAIAVFAYFRA